MSTSVEQESWAERSFLKIVKETKDERFEDGLFNSLSQSLPQYLSEFNSEGVVTVRRLWQSQKIDHEVYSESLRWLGRLSSPTTVEARLGVLVDSLKATVPSVRDAAALGLSSLGDPRAIPALEEALRNEQDSAITDSYEQVLQELKS